MEDNTMIVLIVLIVALLIIVLFSWMWIYTPYRGGYHHLNGTMSGMMNGY